MGAWRTWRACGPLPDGRGSDRKPFPLGGGGVEDGVGVWVYIDYPNHLDAKLFQLKAPGKVPVPGTEEDLQLP